MPSLPNDEASSRYIPNDSETYDEWFKRQVEIGLREADDPNTILISHEEVFSSLEERRKQWRERAAQQRDVA